MTNESAYIPREPPGNHYTAFTGNHFGNHPDAGDAFPQVSGMEVVPGTTWEPLPEPPRGLRSWWFPKAALPRVLLWEPPHEPRAGTTDENDPRPPGWRGQWPPALCLGCGAVTPGADGFHAGCHPSRGTADSLWRLGADMSAHLVTTPVRCETCRACGDRVYAGLAAGMPAVVDPTRIEGPGAELVWRLAGRASFDLAGMGDRTELVYRDEVRIRSRRYPIHGQHACDYLGRICVGYDPTNPQAQKGRLLMPQSRAARTPTNPPF